jgi:hypothetical protein
VKLPPQTAAVGRRSVSLPPAGPSRPWMQPSGITRLVCPEPLRYWCYCPVTNSYTCCLVDEVCDDSGTGVCTCMAKE